MIINHNVPAMNTYRNLSVNNGNTSKSLEKLSSGLRINRAGDDAAGLSISEKMRSQIRGLDQASRNAQDAISLIQTAEGGLSETHSILQRMAELANQAASGTLSATDSAAAQAEIVQLNSEIDRISTSTSFNTKNLLDGTFGAQLDTATSTVAVGTAGVTGIDIAGAKASTTYTIGGASGAVTLSDGAGNTQTVNNVDGAAGVLSFSQLGVRISVNASWTAAGLSGDTVITTAAAAVTMQIGANNSVADQLGVSISKIDSSATSLNTTSINIATQAGARTAMDVVKTAINTVSAERSKLGAYQNRLEHTINNLGTSSENMTAAESRIRDVDMAKEMMSFQKNSILSQAATAMLAQANQQPQGVLQLLK